MLQSVYYSQSGSASRFVLNLTVPQEANQNYGAPATVAVSVNITGPQFSMAVLALGKTPTR